MRRDASLDGLVPLLFLLALSSCGQILGLGDFTDVPAESSGAGGSGGAGDASSAAGTSTTSTSSAIGGMGGGGGASCGDLAKDGDESDVDCGGSCAPCADGAACGDATDCGSGVCAGGACAAPTCHDGVQNAAETGVDCGGGAASGCQKCPDGSGCEGDEDCAGDLCADGLCCTPEAAEVTCAGHCDALANNCGQPVDCGGCAAPMVCGAGNPGTPNVCGCTPTCPLWVKTFGDASSQYTAGVVVDSSSNVIITGSISGTTDFGGGPIVNDFTFRTFLAKFDSAGNHIWSKSFGGQGPHGGITLAVDADESIFLLGNFQNTINLGGATLTSAGNDDIFLAKFDADGNHIWSKRFGDNTNQSLNVTMSTDGIGNLLMAGQFSGTINLGGATLTSAGDDDIILAKILSDGTPSWSKRFGDIDYDAARGVVDPSGNLLIAGEFQGSVNFGGGSLVAEGDDAFIAKFNNNGSYSWSKRFGDASDQAFTAVATDPDGDLVVAGGFNGQIDLGGQPLISDGSSDMLVAKFSSTGMHLWSERFGDVTNQWGASITTGSDGKIVVSCYFDGTLDFGQSALTTFGALDTCTATFDASGAFVWARQFGTPSQEYFPALGAWDSRGNLVVAGTLVDSMDLGLGPVASAGSWDIFVAKYAP